VNRDARKERDKKEHNVLNKATVSKNPAFLAAKSNAQNTQS